MSAEVIGGDGRIKDRQGVPPQGIAFRGQRTTDFGPLAAGWNGPFGFDEVFDSAQAFNGSRFVAPVSGYYEFTTNYSGSGFVGGVLVECSIIKNGNNANAIATDITVVRSDGWVGVRASSGPIFLVAGDYVESMFYTPSAGGTIRGTANERSLFAGNLIGVTNVMPEPLHLVGGVGEPPLNSGVNYGINYAPVAFWKEGATVHLQGLFGNTVAGATLFTLPVGYRPGAIVIMRIASNITGGLNRVDINPLGQVSIESAVPAPSPGWASLTGVAFRAEV